MLEPKRWSTTNRLVCLLAYWFWESHSETPHKVYRVYGFYEYFTRSGRHVWVQDGSNLRTLWRAIGVIFPTCKRLWDKIEKKLWEPEPEGPHPERWGM